MTHINIEAVRIINGKEEDAIDPVMGIFFERKLGYVVIDNNSGSWEIPQAEFFAEWILRPMKSEA